MKKLLFVVFFVSLALLFLFPSKTHYERSPDPVPIPPVEVPDKPKQELKRHIADYPKPVATPQVEAYITSIFGDKAEEGMATLKHESGLRLDAQNWNCIYEGRSRSCRVEDREKAWSVDCGIGQTNVKGKTCPPELFTLEGSMAEVARRFKAQGLEAWTSYTSGAYKKFL